MAQRDFEALMHLVRRYRWTHWADKEIAASLVEDNGEDPVLVYWAFIATDILGPIPTDQRR